MNWNARAAPAPETNISNFPFNEREIKNIDRDLGCSRWSCGGLEIP